MKREDVQKLIELSAFATTGPWTAEGTGSEGYKIHATLPGEKAPDVYNRVGFYGGIADVRAGRGWEGLVANAEFIAQSRNLMPLLARDWLRMRGVLEEIAGYEIGDKGTCDINLYHCVMDARQALKETDGETK